MQLFILTVEKGIEMKKNTQMPNVVSMLESMEKKTRMEGERANNRLADALTLLDKEIRQVSVGDEPNGASRLRVPLEYAARAAKRAEKADREADVALILMAAWAALQAARPGLVNFSGAGRWLSDEEHEGRGANEPWKVGIDTRWGDVKSYPSHMSGMINYILTGKK